MADAIGVCILYDLPHPVRSRVNFLARKRIGVQHETVALLVETGKLSEEVSRQIPKLLIEAIQNVAAIHSDLFHDFLVEVIKKLFPGIALARGYIGFQFMLELVEFELNLFRRATLLVNRG